MAGVQSALMGAGLGFGLEDVWECLMPIGEAVKAVVRRSVPFPLFRVPNLIRLYWLRHGRLPRLLPPRRFTEKVLWRCMFADPAVFGPLADKWAVRAYVESRIGAGYLSRCLWLGDDPAGIPFDSLPERFVEKATHGSGMGRIVRDKAALDRDELVAACRQWLGCNYYRVGCELHYRDIPPRIMVEEFIDDGAGFSPRDFKFFVFDGEVAFVQIDVDRFTGHRQRQYDANWLPQLFRFQFDPILEDVPRPRRLDEMIAVARALGRGWSFVRVDLYETPDRVVFGEMTMTPLAGQNRFNPDEYDLQYGRMWKWPDRVGVAVGEGA